MTEKDFKPKNQKGQKVKHGKKSISKLQDYGKWVYNLTSPLQNHTFNVSLGSRPN
jgi:hypothetical protein